MNTYDLSFVRERFPALDLRVNGYPAAFFDGPGGTQVPREVIEAMNAYLVNCNANAAGRFETSRRTDETVAGGRQALADFLGARPAEIAFGQNTTTLLYQLAFALARHPGHRDEIVITALDHEANRGPWLDLAERGFKVREVPFHRDSCLIDMDAFGEALGEKTLVAAFNYASNSVGTISPVAEMAALAREAGAVSVVDAVHYAPHGIVDAGALGADYLVCSAYKFFGPHLGVLYGRGESFSRLPAYHLRVQSHEAPRHIETGTLNFAGIAGAAAAVDFIADLGRRCAGPADTTSRRPAVLAGMQALEAHEQGLFQALLDELARIPGVRLYGPPAGHPRTPTVSFTIEGKTPGEAAAYLDERGVFVWNGHFYAIRFVECQGLDRSGGLIRVGLAPYNTEAEVDRLLEGVRALAGGAK